MAYRFSNRLARPFALLAAGSLAAAVLSGCSDPVLEGQIKFDQNLAAISSEYAQALGGRPDLLASAPSEESLTALRAIADRAGSLTGGSQAQQTAARGLSLSIYRTTASLAISRARAIESSHEDVRGIARAAFGLAAELDAIAEASATLNLASDRADAQRQREEASSQARTLQTNAASLESPMNLLESRMREANARLAQLDQENAVLLRKARESNPQTALAFVEEAASVQAEARAVRTSLANEDIARGELAINKSLVETRLASAKNLQAAAGAALELLAGFESDVKSGTQKTRDLAAELRVRADELLKAVADERAGALQKAYESAASDLGRTSGTSGALANTVTTEELRLGMLQFNGTVAEAQALLAAKGADAAGVTELKSTAETLLASLREKSTLAADQMATAGEDPASVAMKSYVEGVKKAAGDADIAKLFAPPEKPKPFNPAAGPSKPAAGGASAAAPSGPDNLADVLAKLGAAGKDPIAGGAVLVEMLDDSSKGGRALKSMMGQSFKAMEPMLVAVKEKFGDAGAAAASDGMTQGLPGLGSLDFTSLTEKSNDGRKAVYELADGSELTLVRGASGWKIDMLASLPPNEAAMIEQAAPMAGMMAAPMKKAAESVAAKIRAGEYDSPAAAMQAFQQELMSAMGSLFGG